MTPEFNIPAEAHTYAAQGKPKMALHFVAPEIRQYFRDQGINPGITDMKTAQTFQEHFEGEQYVNEGVNLIKGFLSGILPQSQPQPQPKPEPDRSGEFIKMAVIALGIAIAVYFIAKKA